MINPKSLAGILLREHDTPRQALAYAERKAQMLGAMNNGMACDYMAAAKQLGQHIKANEGKEGAPL